MKLSDKSLITVPDIRIIGPIDEELYEDFVMKMDTLEISKKVNKNKPLVIEITSEGGSPYIALAIVSRIRRCVFDVTTVGNGLVASAATLILACGDRRYMTQESWLMVHEDTGAIEAPSVTQAKRDLRHKQNMEEQWNIILESKTKLDREEWARLHAVGDTYLTPELCLEMGLIDEII